MLRGTVRPLVPGLVAVGLLTLVAGLAVPTFVQQAADQDAREWDQELNFLTEWLRRAGRDLLDRAPLPEEGDDGAAYRAGLPERLRDPDQPEGGWTHAALLAADGRILGAWTYGAEQAQPEFLHWLASEAARTARPAAGRWGFVAGPELYLAACRALPVGRATEPGVVLLVMKRMDPAAYAFWMGVGWKYWMGLGAAQWRWEPAPAEAATDTVAGPLQLRPDGEDPLACALVFADGGGRPLGTLLLRSLRPHRAAAIRLVWMILPALGCSLLLAVALGLSYAHRHARLLLQSRFDSLERLALRAANAGTWCWNGRRAIWSERKAQLHGLSGRQEHVTIEDWLARIHPDDREQVRRQVEATRETSRLELRYRVGRPDGRLCWVQDLGERTSVSEQTETGEQWYGVTLDITEQVEAAERLRANEQRYRAIIEHQNDAVCRWRLDTTLTFANAQYRQLYGLTDADIGHKRWIDFVPAADQPAVTRTYEALGREPRTLSYEHAVQLPDGSTRWVLWVDVPLFDERGVCTEFQSVGRDITERRRVEEALRESEERFRRIVDTAQEGVWTVDPAGRLTFVNERMVELLGRPAAELLGRPLREFVDGPHPPPAAVPAGPSPDDVRRHFELTFRRADGRVVSTLVATSPFVDATGRPPGTLGLVTDVSDFKRTEKNLLAQELLFRTVFEDSPLGLVLVNPDGTTRRVNRTLAAMLGYTEDELLARTVAEVTHPDDLAVEMPQFRRLVAGEIKHYALEKRLCHRDGSEIWVRLTCSIIEGPECVVIGLMEDVTLQRKSETALRTLFEQTAASVGGDFIDKMVEQLAAILEVDCAFAVERTPGGAISVARHQRVGTQPAAGFDAGVGLLSEQLLGGRSCLHADGSAGAENPRDQALRAGGVHGYVGIPVFDGQGQLLGALGVLHSGPLRDTALSIELLRLFALRCAAELGRRRHDAQLAILTAELEKRVEERTAQLAMQALAMDSTMEGMAVLRDSRYIYMNGPHAEMYGYSPDELMGESWERLYSAEEQTRLRREAFTALDRERRWRGEVTGLRKDGTLFAGELSLALTPDGFLICSCRDVSIAHAARQTLAERSVMMERASRAKDEFLASMSHELRTPLASVLMASESLRQHVYGPLSERQAQVLKSMEESGHHLLELINDILDLSKIEAGKLTLTLEPVPVRQLAEAALRMLRASIQGKQLQVSVQIEPAELVVEADTRRLRQMLLNLLSNAVKFTPAGGRIGIQAGFSTRRDEVLLTVWDTGIGIDPADFSKVFRPFAQLDSSLARRYGGTGLGLALVMRMAELHGGGISLQSEMQKGSAFTLRLPVRPSARATASGTAALPAEAPAPGPAEGVRVLVVDDNQETLGIICDALAHRGYQVARARNGTEAVTLALTDPPDLILLDIQMPGMDGLEVTRVLRSQTEHPVAAVPIVALTALAMPGDRERCLVAGMTDYLTKPVQIRTLLDAVRRHTCGSARTIP